MKQLLLTTSFSLTELVDVFFLKFTMPVSSKTAVFGMRGVTTRGLGNHVPSTAGYYDCLEAGWTL